MTRWRVARQSQGCVPGVAVLRPCGEKKTGVRVRGGRYRVFELV